MVDGDSDDGREWMAAVVELPVSTALTLDRSGISVGFVAAVNLVSRAPAPPLFI